MDEDDGEFTIFEPSRQTVGDVVLSDFQRYDARLRSVGALSPIAGEVKERFVIDQPEVVIGRDPQSNIVLPDSGVSRKHARIYQTDTDFVIEDLGSSNGTYVDGVPVVSCVLNGGDSIQVGHTLFLFDRLLEHVTDG